MSLISDALKTAQRERTGRNQAGNEKQPLIDGFFPYVSSSKTPARRRLLPIVVVSVGAVALLGFVGWAFLNRPTRITPAGTGPRIVLPPPVAASKPTLVDSAKTRRDTQVVASANSVAPSPQAAGSESGNGTRAASPSSPPASPPAPRVVVRDARAAGGAETVIARPTESIPRAPATTPRTEAPARPDYEAQATALFNAGDMSGAREKFMLATRLAPTARAWTNYGVTLQRLGDNAGAAAAYQSAIGVDANYLEAWLYQGRLAADARDFARAVPLFQRARAINPRSSEVNIELARLESELKNWTETRRFAEEAVRVDPSNYRGQWYLAIASDQLKDGDTAVRAYTAYLQAVGAAEREQAQYVGYARERLASLRGKP